MPSERMHLLLQRALCVVIFDVILADHFLILAVRWRKELTQLVDLGIYMLPSTLFHLVVAFPTALLLVTVVNGERGPKMSWCHRSACQHMDRRFAHVPMIASSLFPP